GFGHLGPGRECFHSPADLAFGPCGTLFVADTGNRRISRWSPEGRPLETFSHHRDGQALFVQPGGLEVDRRGCLYWAAAGAGHVLCLTAAGAPLALIGDRRCGAPLSEPLDAAVHPTGQILVAEAGANRLQVFDAAGHPLTSVTAMNRYDNFS